MNALLSLLGWFGPPGPVEVLIFGLGLVAVAVAFWIAWPALRSLRGKGKLAPCPDCGHPVSPEAETCPKCGRPLK